MYYTLSEALANLPSLIDSRRTFVINEVDDKLNETAKRVEEEIEAHGMTCRVYTRNRGYAILAAGFVPYVGWAALGSLVAHRLTTFNPDFEVGKDLKDKKIYVNYKRVKGR